MKTDNPKRIEITADETEWWINYWEDRLKTGTLSDKQAALLERSIEREKETLRRMRAGTLRIWQRIPGKVQPNEK